MLAQFALPEDPLIHAILVAVLCVLVGAVAGRLAVGRGFGLIGDGILGLLGALAAYGLDRYTDFYDLFDFGEDMERMERIAAALVCTVGLILLSKVFRRRRGGEKS